MDLNNVSVQPAATQGAPPPSDEFDPNHTTYQLAMVHVLLHSIGQQGEQIDQISAGMSINSSLQTSLQSYENCVTTIQQNIQPPTQQGTDLKGELPANFWTQGQPGYTLIPQMAQANAKLYIRDPATGKSQMEMYKEFLTATGVNPANDPLYTQLQTFQSFMQTNFNYSDVPTAGGKTFSNMLQNASEAYVRNPAQPTYNAAETASMQACLGKAAQNEAAYQARTADAPQAGSDELGTALQTQQTASTEAGTNTTTESTQVNFYNTIMSGSIQIGQNVLSQAQSALQAMVQNQRSN
jgi:hypothetical protein